LSSVSIWLSPQARASAPVSFRSFQFSALALLLFSLCFNQSQRKERNGQLIALGVLVEEMFKSGDDTARQKWTDGAKKYLKDRNLSRAMAAFSRLGGT
jgi:hypothetical protein